MDEVQIYLLKDGEQIGPFTLTELQQRAAEGLLSRSELAWTDGLQEWVPLGTIRGVFSAPPKMPSAPPLPQSVPFATPRDDMMTISRIADYERISGILWIVLGIIQICTIVGIIAGVWNVFAGFSRRKMVPLIQARNPCVPTSYRNGLTMLIVIAVINFLLGGVIGIAFVAFDFYIRDLVMKNSVLFEGEYSSQPI